MDNITEVNKVREKLLSQVNYWEMQERMFRTLFNKLEQHHCSKDCSDAFKPIIQEIIKIQLDCYRRYFTWIAASVKEDKAKEIALREFLDDNMDISCYLSEHGEYFLSSEEDESKLRQIIKELA